MNAGGPPRGVGIQSQGPARAFVTECRLVELFQGAAGCALGHCSRTTLVLSFYCLVLAGTFIDLTQRLLPSLWG